MTSMCAEYTPHACTATESELRMWADIYASEAYLSALCTCDRSEQCCRCVITCLLAVVVVCVCVCVSVRRLDPGMLRPDGFVRIEPFAGRQSFCEATSAQLAATLMRDSMACCGMTSMCAEYTPHASCCVVHRAQQPSQNRVRGPTKTRSKRTYQPYAHAIGLNSVVDVLSPACVLLLLCVCVCVSVRRLDPGMFGSDGFVRIGPFAGRQSFYEATSAQVAATLMRDSIA
jgi:hypothetical protein